MNCKGEIKTLLLTFLFCGQIIFAAPLVAAVLHNGSSKTHKQAVRIMVTGITDQGRRVSNTGTGFFVSSEGHIITAFHVVGKDELGDIVTWAERKNNPTITIERWGGNGRLMEPDKAVRLIDKDINHDIALLRLSGNNYPAVKCTAKKIKEGKTIEGIGWRKNKNVYDPIKGEIARADPQVIGERYRLIADSAYGHSGAPVFNDDYVFAVVTSGESGDIAPQGETYAIPIEYAVKLLPQDSKCSKSFAGLFDNELIRSNTDFTALFQIAELEFKDRGHSLAFKQVQVLANYSAYPLYSIEYGSTADTGDFDRCYVEARRISLDEHTQILKQWSDREKLKQEAIETQIENFRKNFAAYRTFGERIGKIIYNKETNSFNKTGHAVRLMGGCSPRVEKIPAGVLPFEYGKKKNMLIVVLSSFESSREDASDRSFGQKQYYDSQRTLMFVNTDQSLVIDTTSISKNFFYKGQPTPEPGGIVLQAETSLISLDMINAQKGLKAKIAWDWDR